MQSLSRNTCVTTRPDRLTLCVRAYTHTRTRTRAHTHKHTPPKKENVFASEREPVGEIGVCLVFSSLRIDTSLYCFWVFVTGYQGTRTKLSVKLSYVLKLLGWNLITVASFITRSYTVLLYPVWKCCWNRYYDLFEINLRHIDFTGLLRRMCLVFLATVSMCLSVCAKRTLPHS